MDRSYPLLAARTQSFSLGSPTSFTLSPDGRRALFLRTRGGDDPIRCLWALDVASGAETLLADPLTLGVSEDESEQEKIRRERERDRSAGIPAYQTDASVRTVTFALKGKLFLVNPETGETTELPAATPVSDPRLSPDGAHIAYVGEGALRVIGADGKNDRALAEPDGPEVSWGLPEHEAAESMDRHRGYWWSPAGDKVIAARVDDSPVQVWWIADPANPATEPRPMRYPSVGTPNADVSLWLLGLDGSRTKVELDDEYITAVTWDDTALLAVGQNRAQSELRIVAIDPVTAGTEVLHEDTDPAWTVTVRGLPAHTAGGALVWSVEDGETRRLVVAGKAVTPPGLQLIEVLDVDGDTVLFVGSVEPTERQLWAWSAASGLQQLTTEPGLHSGTRAGGVTVIQAHTFDGRRTTVEGREVPSYASTSPLIPKVDLFAAGARGLRTAVLFPTGHVPGSRKLPVLMDPYGGPAAQMVLAVRGFYYTSQWLADQGFAVVIADGRGTPNRGPAWDRTIHGDTTEPLLEDQIDALHAAAERHPDLDLSRVAIRGWSAGGYLAALAVLRRPEVFHAAVAGAPTIDMREYSSHWMEQYIGRPESDAYRSSSLIEDAPKLRRPLLLVHGLADDNVFPLHSLRLSAALLAAGRPHSVLPLPGVTHMPSSDPELMANLVAFEARYLLDALDPVRDYD